MSKNKDILDLQQELLKLATKIESFELTQLKLGKDKYKIISSMISTENNINFHGDDWQSLSYQNKYEILFIRSLVASLDDMFKVSIANNKYDDLKLFVQKATINVEQSINQLKQERGTLTAFIDTLVNFLNNLIQLIVPKYNPGLFSTSDQLLQDGKTLLSKLDSTIESAIEEAELDSVDSCGLNNNAMS